MLKDLITLEGTIAIFRKVATKNRDMQNILSDNRQMKYISIIKGEILAELGYVV